MARPAPFQRFQAEENGSVLLFGAMCMVLLIGMVGVIFDIGRLSSTHSELQSFADSVSLTAAAELDGQPDALSRARAAANTLITGKQTFAEGAQTLIASDVIDLTFYKPDAQGKFTRSATYATNDARSARYVEARVADHSILAGLTSVFDTLGKGVQGDATVAARAVAGFALEACNVAPVAVCLPSVSFDARTQVGTTLELSTAVGVGQLAPGQIAAVDTLTGSLDGLAACAGLFGAELTACLLAARTPKTACTGQGGLVISASVNGNALSQSFNTRFEQFSGAAAGFANNPAFSGAPNVLSGLTDSSGLCGPLDLGTLSGANADISLPPDDCIGSGGCAVQGNGTWTAGRAAYINAHYNGTDPHPSAKTRFQFFQAEVAASGTIPAPTSLIEALGGTLGGTVGGLLGGSAPAPKFCAPQDNLDTSRRLMVVAGIDCSNGPIDTTASAPPVQEFFEVFALGPARNGKLAVEITACLGTGCGKGNLNTDVVDVVRLVE